jgi:hypothetical protein
MGQTDVSFCIILQKSQCEALKMLKTAQAKEATVVKIQDQTNVDLLFRHQGYHAL